MISVETSIFKSLLYDEYYARTVMPYLEESYFEGSHKTMFAIYKDLFDNYNNIPTVDAIALSVQKYNIGEQEFEEIAKIISDSSKNRNDIPQTEWMVKETESYVKDKAIFDAISQSLEIIDGTNDKLDKNAIPDLLDNALGISFDTSIGFDFFDDADKLYDIFTSEDSRLRFPLEALNRLSNGGHKKKALSCVLAGTNVGKSSLMCYLAGEFMKQGKNVAYISMEMAEEDVYERIYANILDVRTDDVKLLKREDFIGKVEKIKEKTQGKLKVKQYPTGAAHAGHFRHFLKELRQKKKFTPDIIFIDYLNICASSRYKSMTGINSYSYIKAVAEEIRGLAVELDTCIMTGTQVNRGGADETTPDMTSTSESWGVPQTLDFMFTMAADQVLADNNQQLICTIKTRWGNKNKTKGQLVGIDWDKMRYYDVGDSSTEDIKQKVGQNKPDLRKRKSPTERIPDDVKKPDKSIQWD